MKRSGARLLVLLLCVLLTASLVLGILLVRHLTAPAMPENLSEDSHPITAGQRLGPYSLVITDSRIGNTLYSSFQIYYIHEDSEELWYSCGRMFPASEVRNIQWENEQFDVAVLLKSGDKQIFSYDGNNVWQ